MNGVTTVLNWLKAAMKEFWPRLMVIRQLSAVWQDIRGAKGPADGVGALAAATVVIINREFLAGWQDHIPEEAVERFGPLRGWMKVVTDEVEIPSTPYALHCQDLTNFRRGIPIVKKPIPFRERRDLGKGGRELDEAERQLREELAYQVYVRTEQARGLFSREGGIIYDVPSARRAVWERMAERVGYGRRSDLPRLKLRKHDGDEALSKEELANQRRVRTFETLFAEGAKVAVTRVPGTTRPGDVAALAVASGRNASGELALELEAVLGHVTVLYGASCSLGRKVSFLYRVWTWSRGGTRHRRADEDGRTVRDFRPFHHRVLSAGEFRPAELLLVACHADIDPLLVDPRHFACTREFDIARKLGRYVRGSDESLTEAEVVSVHEALFLRDGPPHSELEAMQDDLRCMALQAFSLKTWQAVIPKAMQSGSGITLFQPGTTAASVAI